MRAPYWEVTRQGKRREIVCGRAYCGKCGRWRLLCDFGYKQGARNPVCRTCERVRQRRRYRRRSPAEVERRREYERFWREAERRRRGIPPRPFGPHSHRVTDRIERRFLEPAPLVAEVKRADHADLARRSGVSERTVRRLVNGESRHVRLDVADRLALALGFGLELLYRGAGARNNREVAA